MVTATRNNCVIGSGSGMPPVSPLACIENAVVAMVLAFDEMREVARKAGRTHLDVYEETRSGWESAACALRLNGSPYSVWPSFAEYQQQVETWRRLPWFADALRRTTEFDVALKRAMQKGGGDS